MSTETSTTIQIRISRKLLQEFNDIANKKAVNKSLLLRNYIETWIQEQKESSK